MKWFKCWHKRWPTRYLVLTDSCKERIWCNFDKLRFGRTMYSCHKSRDCRIIAKRRSGIMGHRLIDWLIICIQFWWRHCSCSLVVDRQHSANRLLLDYMVILCGACGLWWMMDGMANLATVWNVRNASHQHRQLCDLAPTNRLRHTRRNIPAQITNTLPVTSKVLLRCH